MHLQENTVLITGGASGIGKGLARYFYQYENKLIIVGRDTYKLNKLQIELPNIITKQCDLSKQEGINELISYCITHHPDINILINNAGIEHNGLFSSETSISDKIILEEISTNLTAPILLTNGLIANLLQKKEAAIINISSALVFHPKINAAVYSATKSGLHHFTQALRIQLNNTSIKVFEVLPPLTDTPLTQSNPYKKITVEHLVKVFASAFENNQTTILIGKTKWVYWLSRISPRLLKRIMTKRYMSQKFLKTKLAKDDV
jgi:uncharacterized oxidoreductase